MKAIKEAAAPIYDRLVAERGDVVADVARDAEKIRREVAKALNFGAGQEASALTTSGPGSSGYLIGRHH